MIIKIKIILPYLYIKFINLGLSLNAEIIALKPSNGNIGKRLNINKAMLIDIEKSKK